MAEEKPKSGKEQIELITGADVKQDSTVMDKIGEIRDIFLRALCTDSDGNFDSERYEKQKELTLDAIMKNITNDRTIVIKVNGEVAAIGSYEHLGHRDDRPVYELQKTLVMPKFRGQKLGIKVAETLMQQVKNLYPKKINKPAILLTRTNENKVIQGCIKRDWAEISYEDTLAIEGISKTAEELAAAKQQIKEKGFRYFLFNLQVDS